MLLGLAALVYCGVVIWGATSIVGMFNFNATYGLASKSLIDTTVTALEGGQHEQVLSALKELQEKFRPSYENRANYDQLVESAIARMKKETPKTPQRSN